MMRAYSIFDDFSESAVRILQNADISVEIPPLGTSRPEGEALKKRIDAYDIVFISTAQKITEEMLADVTTPKIIATVSIGTDHIHVPESKQHLVKIANAPISNRISVAEHTLGMILALKKQFFEARTTAALGKSKKAMQTKPEDLFGATMGVIGAGGIASEILRLVSVFGMKLLCWTRTPEKHMELEQYGVTFCSLGELLENADIISVNLPLSASTANLISAEKIERIKEDAVFVSTSRTEVVDLSALFDKAKRCPSFRLGLDVDAEKCAGFWSLDMHNIIVTPHIAGGTVMARMRMFDEIARNTASLGIVI